MTNKEIKLELAKVALARCCYTDVNAFNETIRNLYNWIVEEESEKPDVDYSSVSVREIISYLVKNDRYSDKRYASSLVNVFNNNGIHTVGDILRLDRREFMRIKGVGKGSVTRIDDALEELYGIKDW